MTRRVERLEGRIISSEHTILVVDDDTEVRELIAECLENHGFQVVTAVDGNDMRRILAERVVDLVLLDRTMPGGNGARLIPILRARYGMPIILVTALASEDERVWGLETGADDYITKPFDWRELLARIGSVLRRTKQVRIEDIQPSPPGELDGVPTNLERRLAAVLCIDVVGYVRLMSADEEHTLKTWYTHRSAVIDPAVASHKGRIVKLTGDGLLAEFRTGDSAVLCAIEIQDAIDRYNTAVAPERRMLFRMGINVADIVADHQDIYGDGVNLAARLEALAVPGSICVSQAVRDCVPDRHSMRMESLGRKQLKHIEAPVMAYRVVWSETY